ncbi:hypothetical protein L1887_01044 [Cichorium endivia]|nr:hypothetical protein L1887_01044 [Cichorium endivia]
MSETQLIRTLSLPLNPSFVYGPSTESPTLLISLSPYLSNFPTNRFSFNRNIPLIHRQKKVVDNSSHLHRYGPSASLQPIIHA